jgi:hypothetical protein
LMNFSDLCRIHAKLGTPRARGGGKRAGLPKANRPRGWFAEGKQAEGLASGAVARKT